MLRSITRLSLKLTLVLVIALTAPAAGIAKPLSKLLAGSGLSPQDFDMMQATEKQLYTPRVRASGTTLSWSNPATGAHGDVKLAAVRGECVFIEHSVYPRDAVKPVQLKPQMCKSADGRWLLAP
ncbi:hypothetical protein [Microbulbifer sp. S227A]|uniref:hypothetical protein n=1 Tax=Microbulbifer sp. S227A TaxID=3415131 RepID=UPI003C7B17C8